MYSPEGEIKLQWLRVIVVQDLLKAFGLKVKLARIERGYTQVELANKLHTTDRTVSKVESGKTDLSLNDAGNYAVELEISLDDLIHSPQTDRIPRCAEDFFAGMEESKAQKFISLCRYADALSAD